MNQTIINNLQLLSQQYTVNNANKWKIAALKKAINSLKSYDKEIISGEQIKNEIKGIGEGISKRVDEILATGKLTELVDVSDDAINILPEDSSLSNKNKVIEILKGITGIGDKRATSWEKIGVNSLDDLKDRINKKQIKSTHHIDIGIKYYDDFLLKIPRNEIDELSSILEKILLSVSQSIIFKICGSYRRENDFSGDVDVLITDWALHLDPHKLKKKESEIVINYLKIIVDKLKKEDIIIDDLTNTSGGKKYMGVYRLNNNPARRIDIRFVEYNEYYPALIYFTGSKNFNIDVRKKALKKGYSLNEYSLTEISTNNTLVVDRETDIFDILDIEYVSPKNRNI